MKDQSLSIWYSRKESIPKELRSGFKSSAVNLAQVIEQQGRRLWILHVDAYSAGLFPDDATMIHLLSSVVPRIVPHEALERATIATSMLSYVGQSRQIPTYPGFTASRTIDQMQSV